MYLLWPHTIVAWLSSIYFNSFIVRVFLSSFSRVFISLPNKHLFSHLHFFSASSTPILRQSALISFSSKIVSTKNGTCFIIVSFLCQERKRGGEKIEIIKNAFIMNSDEVLNVKKSEQGVDAATLNKKKRIKWRI